MYKISYKADYNAFHIDTLNNQLTLSVPYTIRIKSHDYISIGLNIDLMVSDDWECILNINPALSHAPMMINSSLPFRFIHSIKLYNYSNENIVIEPNTELFRLDFYKKSITLANVIYDRSTDTCSFNFEQLESSFVHVPPQHISFEKIEQS